MATNYGIASLVGGVDDYGGTSDGTEEFDIEADTEELRRRLQEQGEVIGRLRRELQDVQKKNKEFRFRATEEKNKDVIGHLRTELRELRGEEEKNKEVIGRLRTDLQREEEKNTEVTGRLKAAMHIQERLQREVSRLRGEEKKNKEVIGRSQTELNTQKQLRGEVSRLQREVSSAKAEIKTLRNACYKAERDLEQKYSTIKALEKEMEPPSAMWDSNPPVVHTYEDLKEEVDHHPYDRTIDGSRF